MVEPTLRPAFFSALPKRADVAELCELFERGNYAELRRRAASVPPDDAELTRAARELVARTRPDPLVLWLLLLSAGLLAAVAVFAWTRS